MVAATYLNQSFEDPDGVAATLTTQNVHPFVLADAQTMNFEINGAPQAVVFELGTRSIIVAANLEVYPLVDLQTLDVEIDGAPAVTITFNTANFVDITNATAAEVAGELLSQLPGSAFAGVILGAVQIGSLTKGPGSLINVSGGTAAAAFAFPAGVAGVSNFVDITAALAPEVAAVMTAQLTGVTVTDTLGMVEITLDAASPADCIRAVGGLASVALNFPDGLVCGQSQPGFAVGWTHTSVSTYWEFAEYGVGLTFPTGYEPFTLGWNDAQDDDTNIGPLDLANFSGDFFENFTWFIEDDQLGGTVAAAFNTTPPLTPTSIEHFDQGWPGIPGAEDDIYEFLPGDLTLSFFGGNPFEDFITGWPAENDGTVLVGLVLWTPGQGGDVETFEPSNDIHTEVQVMLAVAGDSYEISVQGFPAVHVATDAIEANTASNLADGINNLPTDVSAIAIGDRVQITNTSTDTAPFEVGVRGTVLSNMIKVFDGPTDPDLNWSGADRNKFC